MSIDVRIDLGMIAAKLSQDLSGLAASDDLHIGTSFDNDFTTLYAKRTPAVWVLAQRIVPISSGGGFSGAFRQKMSVEVMTQIIVARSRPGVYNNEAQMSTIHTAVINSILGWRPNNGDGVFKFGVTQDGKSGEPLTTTLQSFKIETSRTLQT